MNAEDEDNLLAEFEADPFVQHGLLDIRAARIEVTEGRLGKRLDPPEMGVYVLVLVHPDDEPDPATARARFEQLAARLRLTRGVAIARERAHRKRTAR